MHWVLSRVCRGRHDLPWGEAVTCSRLVPAADLGGQRTVPARFGSTAWFGMAVLLAVLWGAGCTIAPQRPVDQLQAEALYQDRSARLLAYDEWRFSGRLGLEWEAQRWSGTLSWRESSRQQILDLSGPLGRGGGRLTVEPGQAALVMRTGERYFAPDPDDLVELLTGQRIPVAGLGFWVRGIGWPGVPEERLLDSEGKLLRIQQGGWDVRFNRYERQGDLDLPRSIELTREGLVMELVILTWRIPGLGDS